MYGWRGIGLIVSLLALVMAPAQADLISHWMFDGDLEDSGGFADNFGTIAGAAEATFEEGVDGTADGAIVFDGVDDLVEINHDIDGGLPIYDHPAYSVALWVKGNPQKDKRVFSCGYSQGNNNPLFNIGTDSAATPTGVVDIFIRNGADPAVALVNHRKSAGVAFDGRWHHIAWVDDNGNAALYVDGRKDPTSFSYTKEAIPFDRTSIGGIVRATNCCWFAGSIDDVRVYDHILTEEEIRGLLDLYPCPAVGDTHVESLTVEGTADGGPGIHTFTAEGAVDDSGDPIFYSFTAESDLGDVIQVGPQDAATAAIGLYEAAWTVTVRVDSGYWWCPAADDATASIEVAPAIPEADKRLISRYTFDDTLDDSEAAENHGNFIGLDGPVFADDAYGNPARDCPQRVLTFDGVDDMVQLAQNDGLPIHGRVGFTIAMWIKGDYLAQSAGDRRIFSEASTTSNNQLFNLGTNNAGTSPSLDFYLRDDANATILNHPHSTGAVFDGAWHHIAWADNYGHVTLFIDGEPDATAFHYAPAVLTTDTTTIGGILRATASHWFTGSIDDVRIYSYALPEAEVEAIIAEADCPPEVLFIRGDTDGNGQYLINDGIQILERLFADREAYTSDCEDTGDLDDDGILTIGDAIWLFNYIFGEGDLKKAPYPPADACGEDPTPETTLGCNAGIVEACK
ncbi:MAG: LamG domain-containing protein [Planctomycetes bacterium]|nr:LamG domain-containing protein [Planctomycetota bacterium]